MRIAIDYSPAIHVEAGVGAYSRNLVAAMLAQDASNYYTLLTSGRPTKRHPFPEAQNVRGRSLLIPEHYLRAFWYRWEVPFPATLFSGPADIYHSLCFVLPPLGKKVRKVVTVYDLSFFEYPEYSVPYLVAHLCKEVPRAISTADIVTTISHHAERSIIERFQIPREKLVVIPPGVDRSFQRITDPFILDTILHKFGLKKPFVLTVGTLEPRKNHIGLIKAFYQAQQQKNGPAMLAIVGGKGWCYDETMGIINELKLDQKVRFLGYVNDTELVALYSLADMFAYPSFFEGFGIPLLEAMACGTPVITSNISSLPEVASGAALLINPHDIDEIAQAITRLLEDEQLRIELQEQGYQRIKQYTWKQSAQKMLHVYQELHNRI